MTKRIVIIDPPFEGFKDEGFLGRPKKGDFFVSIVEQEVVESPEDFMEGCRVILTPIKKVLDWDKVSGDVFVSVTSATGFYRRRAVTNPYGFETGWQAHTIGDKCPVDPDACIVRVERRAGNNPGPCLACDIVWSQVVNWHFVKLADGYEYP